jgi:cell division protein FtsZ
MNTVQVIGIGSAGIQIINHLLGRVPQFPNAGAIILNKSELSKPITESKLLLTPEMRGLGSTANFEWAKTQTVESKENIERFIHSKTVILTAGMGSQSSYTLPLVAQIADKMGIRVVGVVSMPFSCEGRNRHAHADAGLTLSRKSIHVLNIINADEVIRVIRGRESTETLLEDAFSILNDWMAKSILFFSDLFKEESY